MHLRMPFPGKCLLRVLITYWTITVNTPTMQRMPEQYRLGNLCPGKQRRYWCVLCKKEALTLPAAGVQFPARLQQSIASTGIVHRFSKKVSMKISENTQSQQFRRCFGDWQNDPAQNSNIRFSQRIDTEEWAERILPYRLGQQLPLCKMPCFLSGKECIKNSKIFAGFLAISMLLWYSFL